MASDDLTPAELAELRRLLDAAMTNSPAPWTEGDDGVWLDASGGFMGTTASIGADRLALHRGIAALVNAAPRLLAMAERELHGRMAMKHEH